MNTNYLKMESYKLLVSKTTGKLNNNIKYF